MRFDTKIAVVVRADLQVWQKLNVACFLSGGVVGASPEVVGAPYRDGSGTLYGPMIRQPVMVFEASADELMRTRARALSRDLTISIFTHDLFATGNDDDNRAAVAAVSADDLDLVGLAMHADRKLVDKVTKGLTLHR